MSNSVYIAVSAQRALQQRLDTLANNVSNATTPGFRAEEVRFETILSKSVDNSLHYASPGQNFISRRAGAMTHTGNPLDIAVSGNAWMAVNTPAGQAYTRDGRLKITATGELQTTAGMPVLDLGGTPIQINQNAGPIIISREGEIFQGEKLISAIGLFELPANAKLDRAAGSAVTSSLPAQPVTDRTKIDVMQGHLEQSNVNPVMEMARLIEVSRGFEAVSQTLADLDSSLKNAVRSLGSKS